MNRFRQLKQKLIKSKRDSQKLQQLENDQKQVELWLEKQLEYYGISKDSYRLRQISNTVFLEDMGLKGCGESMGQLRNGRIDCEIQEKSFMKKTQYETCNNQNNYSSLSFSKNKYNQQQTLSQQQMSNPQSLSSKRIVCKKNQKNFQKKHLSSMNDIDSLLKNDNKNSQQTNIFKSQQIQTPNQQDKQKLVAGMPKKQLDYYTLILQLTAQLNYSRLNKQQSNQKSILKQIKHLIQYIQNKSSSTNIPASKSSNKKSTHTFSSVYSNESLPNEAYGESKMEENVEQKRIIKYKLIQEDKRSKYENLNSYGDENDDILNQNQPQQDQHNRTFGSDSGFEQNDREQDQENNKSIIDMVDAQQYHQKNQNILTQQNRQNSIMQNSPLSKITQHQSEYTDSVNPSLKVSPTKPSPNCTPDKLFKYKTFHRQLYNKNFIQNRLQSQYSENKFNKKYEPICYEEPEQYQKESPKLAPTSFNNTAKDLLLLQNELILKKLSSNNSNFDKTQQINPANTLFEQSLEYKKILYMLDSQIANNSDHKNRTISSLFGKSSSSSSQPNLYEDGPSNNNKFIKNIQRINNIFIESDSSAKSFIKEIFQSNSDAGNKEKHLCTNQHDHNGNKCLMNNLQKLFCNQIQLQRNSLLKNNNLNTRLHKRSYTCLQNSNNNPSSKNSPTNLSNPLNQSLCSQSQNHIYDKNKYESIKTQYQYQDESIYHKISRNSYLTSQNHSKNYYQSSSENQSRQNMTNSSNKENIKSLIVKKKKNGASNLDKQKEKEKENEVVVPMKFIVKKKKNTINNKENVCSVTQSQETSRIQENNESQKSQIKDTYRSQSQKFQNQQQTSQVRLSDYELISLNQNLTQQNSHHNKSSTSSQTSNISKKSIISNDSKSSNRSSKHIKYKVYKGNSTSLSGPNTSQKQDKRKVLKDIVSMLNSKYNKKITLTNE